MPNWCNTNITFYSNDKKQLEKLYQAIMRNDLAKGLENTNVDENWIGNALMHAHPDFNYEDLTNLKYGPVRSFIEDGSDLDNLNFKNIFYFWINLSDAWIPHIKPFCCLLEKPEYNNIKLAYMAEEPGCEIYEKYDPEDLFYNGEEYIVDTLIPDPKIYQEYPEIDDMSSEPVNLEILLHIFKVDSYEKAIEKAEFFTENMQKEYDEGFCYIHKIENLKNPC